MKAVSGATLERAVLAICPEIDLRVQQRGRVTRAEDDLRAELACCVLSSQVPYEMASAAASRLRRRSLLHPNAPYYARALEDALLEPLYVNASWRRYRFPRSRAGQLASTFRRLAARQDGLSGLIRVEADPEATRSLLMREVDGFGLKQASMFLRNIGLSFDLAILDRHVLRYALAVGLTGSPDRPLTYDRYLELEERLRGYASRLRWPVGYLDWAVWIVMSAANTELRS